MQSPVRRLSQTGALSPGSSPTDESTLDHLAREEPLEIRVNGRPISITMRIPGHDQELVAGFLWSEGILQHHQQILSMEACGPLVKDLQNTYKVELQQEGLGFIRLGAPLLYVFQLRRMRKKIPLRLWRSSALIKLP